MSLVSLWELAIKHAKGRLPHSPGAIAMGVGGAGFRELDLGHRHIIKLQDVALPHGDPFDAMLCAQAASEGLTLLTADRVLLDSDYDTVDARA